MGKKDLLQPYNAKSRCISPWTAKHTRKAIAIASTCETLPAPKDASGLAWASQLAQMHRAHISSQIICIIKACFDLQVTSLADTDKNLFFSSHRKSSSAGAAAVHSVAWLCQGLGSSWFSESFFHDCYLTLSTGCLGSRVLVHIQGWKKWGEEYYWASSCLIFSGKQFSTQRGWKMSWAFPGSITGRSKALDEYS